MGKLISMSKSVNKETGNVSIRLVYEKNNKRAVGYKTLDELLAHDETNPGFTTCGTEIVTDWIQKADLLDGTVEIDGKLELGCNVRVMKEGDPARVTYIKVSK